MVSKAKAEIAGKVAAISALASNIINHIEKIEDFTQKHIDFPQNLCGSM
jgi:hypothetical protein